MSELNAAEHVGKIFAQAQRLMVARQTLVTAQMEADAAERELQRLNGSINLDLGRFDRTRYFTCEGPAMFAVLDDKRQEQGGVTTNVPRRTCTNVISLSSWDFRDGNPEKTPICDDCEAAIARANPRPDTHAKADEVPL